MELHTFQVSKVRLTQYKIESDGDIHLVLKDAAGRRMIAEIPFGSCVPTASRWKKAIAAARYTFTHAYHVTTSWHYVNRLVTVRGLGYFDPPHGQTGAAPNGIELHPVIGVSFPTTTSGTSTTPSPSSSPTVAPTSAPPTSGVVKISSIYFDSPGTDDGSNASLNGEWVAVSNGTGAGQDMTGWTLSDASGHVFTFPAFTFPTGATVEVHTGAGTDTPTDVYWGSGAYIWNNTGDTATLSNGAGVVSSCTYSGSQAPQAVC